MYLRRTEPRHSLRRPFARTARRREALVEPLERRALLSAGELDPTFGGGDGIVTHPDAGRTGSATAAVVLPDGKIITAGGTSGDDTGADFLLARYNADGTLDTTFGDGGRTRTDFAHGQDYAVDLALAPDGKIVVAGTHEVEDRPTELAVARYHPDGTLDTSFDGDGRSLQRITFNGAGAAGVAVQGDGRIVVAATAFSAASGTPDLAAVRYLSSGALDPSFNGGFTLIHLDGSETAAGVTVRPDGRIVLAGRTDGSAPSQGVLVGLTAGGTRDASFGTAGVSRLAGVWFDEAAADLIVTADNRVVGNFTAPGNDLTRDVGVFRVTAAGALDPAFGTGGRVVVTGPDEVSPAGLARQADGKYVFGMRPSSYPQPPHDFTIARITASGALDATFAGDGTADVGLPQDVALLDVVVQPGGRIVGAGAAHFGGGTDAILAGLTPAGALDPTFRSSNAPADPVGVSGSFSDVVVQPDGKILAVGTSTRFPGQTSPERDVYLARFLPDGSADSSFGTAGKVLMDFGASFDGANRVALQSDGRIVISGNVLARFLPNGTLDTTFGGGDGFVPAPAQTTFLGLSAQPDDRLLVTRGGPGQRAVQRYTADGEIDGSFADGGTLTDFTATGIESFAPTDVGYQPNTGKIIVAGSGWVEESGEDWVAIRLNPDGSIDTSFGGGDGAASHDSDVHDLGGRIAIRPTDGYIAMAGNEDDEDAALVRFGPEGQSYGDYRLPDYPAWSYDVAVAPDGKIVIVWADRSDEYNDYGDPSNIRVARFNADGSYDNTFYSLNTDVFDGSRDTPQGVTVAPDGDVIVVGSAEGAPVVLRYQGSGGAQAINLYSDGSLVITGTGAADTLSLTVSGSTLTVQLNNLTRQFDVSVIEELHADLGDGNDTVSSSFDTTRASVFGGAGDDTFTGGAGQQVFFGGDGNDTLRGGDGGDHLYGDGGNDYLDGQLSGDYMSGGGGTDTVDYSSRTAALRVTVGDYESDDGEAGERDRVEYDVEIVRGGAGDDYIAERSFSTQRGSGNNEPRNAFYGGGGNDTLSGGTAVDALFGGPGNDTFLASEVPEDWGWGYRWVTYYGDYYNGGGGNDTVDYSQRNEWFDDLTVSLDGVANDGRLAGESWEAEGDNVDADVENVIGGGRNDVLSGSAGNNRLVGNGGDDRLLGGGGNDVLDGGEGRDWLYGGPGTDTADYSARTAALRISLNGRSDDGEAGEWDNVFVDTENVIGGGGNDVLIGSGTNNRLEGRAGKDTITGGGGRDALYGGEGNDTFYARDGITDAVLDGGPGTDAADKDAADPTQSVESSISASLRTAGTAAAQETRVREGSALVPAQRRRLVGR